MSLASFPPLASAFLPQSPFPGVASACAQKAAMIRVNLAGEEGALAIYSGNLKGLGASHPLKPLIQSMYHQEQVHASLFHQLAAQHHVRPSLIGPLWNRIGYGAGLMTALWNVPAVMALTSAVEEVIEGHYADQIAALNPDTDTDLRTLLIQCQADEIAHRTLGDDYGAQRAPRSLHTLIRWGTHLAISLARRI